MIIINGHSGCNLNINEATYQTTITKTSFSEPYSKRLKLQAKKQREFKNETIFKSPKITGENLLENIYSFEMEYISGLNFLSFVEKSSPKKLKIFFENLKNLLYANIINSSYIPYPKASICKKVSSIRKKLKKRNKIIENCLNFVYNFNSRVLLPAGYCHGDLTFSNIIFTRNSNTIYLIDFLDNFFDTPLQDIVKIRQDTVHHWILHKNTQNIDKLKVQLALSYIDNNLVKFLEQFQFYNEFYKVFQILNLLRIIAYTKDESTYNYIVHHLDLELLK
tara:strand:+ start:39 stop:872 length:834 start_codon:yes stop_codon:yes gene_type:complete